MQEKIFEICGFDEDEVMKFERDQVEHLLGSELKDENTADNCGICLDFCWKKPKICLQCD
jgi:hypothetical protein